MKEDIARDLEFVRSLILWSSFRVLGSLAPETKILRIAGIAELKNNRLSERCIIGPFFKEKYGVKETKHQPLGSLSFEC